MDHRPSSASHRRTQQYLVGMAIHALRAYVKAHELKSGQADAEFSYKIPEDGKSASILDPQGQAVMERPIERWAAEGPAVRLAMIGLKAAKERFEKAAVLAGSRTDVVYYLNIIEQSATLTVDGSVLSKADLVQVLPILALPESLSTVATTFGDSDLGKISAWARIGREVEIEFFQVLGAAERYGLADAVKKEKERGYRLGILRRPHDTEATK